MKVSGFVFHECQANLGIERGESYFIFSDQSMCIIIIKVTTKELLKK